MIVNDESRVINKLETSLTDNARVIIYDHHMFMVKATGAKINYIL
jgi:nanoRNase/pAp phosphatase (c-di-AMP/oligoRNAs hydrolase)